MIEAGNNQLEDRGVKSYVGLTIRSLTVKINKK